MRQYRGKMMREVYISVEVLNRDLSYFAVTLWFLTLQKIVVNWFEQSLSLPDTGLIPMSYLLTKLLQEFGYVCFDNNEFTSFHMQNKPHSAHTEGRNSPVEHQNKLHKDAVCYYWFHHHLKTSHQWNLRRESQDPDHPVIRNRKMNPNLKDRHLCEKVKGLAQVLFLQLWILLYLHGNSEPCSRSCRPKT